MSDLPTSIDIHEEGPREGFQIEPGPISSADKIRLIEALGETGLRHIQVCSFVSPRVVPSWADAETVVAHRRARFDVQPLCGPVQVGELGLADAFCGLLRGDGRR